MGNRLGLSCLNCGCEGYSLPRSKTNRASVAVLQILRGDRSDLIKFCESATARADMAEVERLLRGSVKLDLVLRLLQRHRAEGHRTLVFSQSKKMLNVIAAVLRAHGFRHRCGHFRLSISCKICVNFVHIRAHVNLQSFFRFSNPLVYFRFN